VRPAESARITNLSLLAAAAVDDQRTPDSSVRKYRT
jgi:hypothetical protein